ncbi:MAG: Ig-like domain-containing protein [Odoribacter sp.]|nr:Ig-like domain-containing protein [Odoribacter sp.]
MKKIIFIAIAAIMLAFQGADAKRMSDLKIYINPGHGGYTSNDRPIHLYPFEKNDSLGYWESKSNLYKGLHMYHLLDSLGATPMLSRIKNTEADDRSLSGIAAEANQFGADLFFSIHSNAGEDVNYPLMLYRENTIGTPRYPENVRLSEILGNTLYSNKLPIWTNPLQIAGDLTFYQFMWQGGLGVLRTLYVVGLLSEGGMHEHRPEAYRLMNDDYWYLEAWHFVHAIMEYFDTDDRFVNGNVAGIVYDSHNLREKDMPVTFTVHGRDALAPVNGCKIELVDASGKVVQTRTTDNIYNGVYVFRSVEPGTYTVRTSHGEYYDSESTVEVKANEVTYNDIVLDMRREYPLEITRYTPAVSVDEPISCATILEFDFNTDVDAAAFEAAFTIEPAIDGFFTYSNNYHHATFTPSSSFERDTHYKVSISKDARHPDTHYATPGMVQPLEFEFVTRGRNRLEPLAFYPADGGEMHYASPQIEVRFDGKLDNLNILDKIKVTDSKGNALALVKTRCKFNTINKDYGNMLLSPSKDLVPGETYTVKIDGDLRDAEGLPMGEPLEFTFKAVDINSDVTEGEVFNGFESGAPFSLWAEHSTGYSTTCAVTKNSTTKICGGSSARFSYSFSDNRNGSIVWKYTGEEPLALESSATFGMFVCGDFNNHPLYIGVTSGTDIKWLKVCDLDFVGWRYFEVPLNDLDSSFTYLLSGFKIDQVDSPICTKGSFFIDDLAVKSNNGIGDIETETSNTPAVYYNLQGIEVANPSAGVYIERRGNSARKVTLP